LRIEALSHIRVLNLGILPPALQAGMRSFNTRRLPATIIAGLLVALGFAIPQFIAYREFCSASDVDKRPWCHKLPPSIYSWVQSHYW
jgi:phosphatidylinositol glycan class V